MKSKLMAILIIFSVSFIPLTYSATAENQSQPSSALAVQSDTSSEDPLQEMENVQKNFNRVIQETVRRMRNYQQSGKSFEPDADLVEFADKYLIKIDLPGMQKDKIQIEASNKAITISGERKTERQIGSPDQKEGVYQYERSSGSFFRRMTLPADANIEAIAAKYENGVLEITIPKLKTSSLESKKVQVQ